MSRLAEQILYWLVKRFYHTEIAHSREMKEATRGAEHCGAYRASQVTRVVSAAKRYGVELLGRDLLDLGCNDGALTVQYLNQGPRRVVGVDIDAHAIDLARQKHDSPSVEYLVSTVAEIPLPDESVDTIICFDVFEHVARPVEVLAECKRVLRPRGNMLIGTWGWYHPFAPHLWATMPVPWAHVVFSERTILRTCRQVFHSPWYVPTMHDLDEFGHKQADKYLEETISTDYLNKFLISDFEKVFKASGLEYRTHLEPFGSKYARWTRALLRFPYLREFFTAYLWAVLQKAPIR